MSISVIIPALNEAEHIQKTIETVQQNDPDKLICEIIVVDGGSKDTTRTIAKENGAVVVQSPRSGRAVQMNLGANQAQSDILFFLHADTLVPDSFSKSILMAVDQEYTAGCFRLSFGHPSPILRFYAWLTRFRMDLMRYGDQGLFIRKEVFIQLGGFMDDHRVLEDNEFTRRIRKSGYRFKVLEQSATTSPRRYLEQGTIRLQVIFMSIYLMWQLGFSQDQMIAFYRKRVKNRVPD